MAADTDTHPAVDENGETYMKWYPLNLVRTIYADRRVLDDDESREIAAAARLELEHRLGPLLIAYGRLGAGKAAHVLTALDGDDGRAACGVAGKLTARTDADERAERLDLGPVCVTCREKLAFRRDVAIVVVTRPTKAARRGQGRSTMTTTTTTTERKKAASADLLDRDVYADADSARLKAERLTINNRISGLKTQIKRAAGDAAKVSPLEARLDDLNSRRTLIAQVLAVRSNNVAEATQEQAAALAAGTADAAAELAEPTPDDEGDAGDTTKPKPETKKSRAARKPAASTKPAARRRASAKTK